MVMRGSKTRRLPQSLSGLRFLVGRAHHQASALSSGLRGLGAEVVEIPFIEIRKPRSYKPLDTALQKLHDYDWLILTSVNGVEAVWDRLKKLRLTERQLPQLKIGKSAVALFQQDIERFRAAMKDAAAGEDAALSVGELGRLDDARWERLVKDFFQP